MVLRCRFKLWSYCQGTFSATLIDQAEFPIIRMETNGSGRGGRSVSSPPLDSAVTCKLALGQEREEWGWVITEKGEEPRKRTSDMCDTSLSFRGLFIINQRDYRGLDGMTHAGLVQCEDYTHWEQKDMVSSQQPSITIFFLFSSIPYCGIFHFTATVQKLKCTTKWHLPLSGCCSCQLISIRLQSAFLLRQWKG